MMFSFESGANLKDLPLYGLIGYADRNFTKDQ